MGAAIAHKRGLRTGKAHGVRADRVGYAGPAQTLPARFEGDTAAIAYQRHAGSVEADIQPALRRRGGHRRCARERRGQPQTSGQAKPNAAP